jgi:hypothetical protein
MVWSTDLDDAHGTAPSVIVNDSPQLNKRSGYQARAHRAIYDTHHLPTNSDSSNSEMIETTANTSVAVDPNIVRRIVKVLYPLLLAVYLKAVNPKFGFLNAVQLAQAEAFARTSVDTWGNVSLLALSARLHLFLQSYPRADPRAEVEAMICAGPNSNRETLEILVFSDTVCMAQNVMECDITPSACLTSSARGNLEDVEASIDEDEGDNESLKREIDGWVGNFRLVEFKRFSDDPI